MNTYQRVQRWFLNTDEKWIDICDARKWPGWAYELFPRDIISSLVCKAFGKHEPESDQCGIPEHDYCLWCHVRVPYGVRRT